MSGDKPPRYELHPACAAWPPMSREALIELAEDIKINGQREPVALTPPPDELCIDGRNRLHACDILGIAPITVTYDGDPIAYSISKNLHRRHMDATGLAFAGAKLATLKPGGDGSNQHGGKGATFANAKIADGDNSRATVAKQMGIPAASIDNAKAILEKGTPDVIELAKAGKVPLRAAADYVRHTTKARQVTDPAVIKGKPPKPPRTASLAEMQIAPGGTLSANERFRVTDQRSQVVTQLAALLRLDPATTLDELVRVINVADLAGVPLPTRIVLARGFQHALKLTDADLRPVT